MTDLMYCLIAIVSLIVIGIAVNYFCDKLI